MASTASVVGLGERWTTTTTSRATTGPGVGFGKRVAAAAMTTPMELSMMTGTTSSAEVWSRRRNEG